MQPSADRAQILGGGSAALEPHYRVTPLEALRRRFGDDVEVTYEQGCDIDVIFSLAEGDIVAGLAAGGIDVLPMFWRARTDVQPALPEVRLHNKFWLVDAVPGLA